MVTGLKPSVRRIDTRQAIVGLAVLLLTLHPFVVATASPEPLVLALPWWYWATVGAFAALYAACAYLVLAGQADAESGGNDRAD